MKEEDEEDIEGTIIIVVLIHSHALPYTYVIPLNHYVIGCTSNYCI